MKFKFLYISCLCAGMLLGSCNDMYDFGKDGTLTLEDVFTDYKLTGKFLNKAYSYMPYYGASSAGGTFLACYTDEAQDGQAVVNSAAAGYYDGKASSSDNIINNSLYDQLCQGIYICNVFLANIDYATNMTVEAHRSKWKGEALLLRAYYYLQLIKRFGPVHIVKEPQPLDYDFSKNKVRPTFYENAKEIIADCEAALLEPELPMRVNSIPEKGSMSKSMAYAIMSQVMLYAASPLWCGDNNYWDEALLYTERAMNELKKAGFDLYDPTNVGVPGCTIYQDYFLLAPEYVQQPKQDVETIYAQKGQIGDLWQNCGLPITPGATRAGVCPTQELVDAYETIDGKFVLNIDKPYLDDEHLMPNYNTEVLVEHGGLYDPENPYANRDPRLKSSVYYNGSIYDLKNNKGIVYTNVGGNCGIDERNTSYTRTGYYLRKWIHYDSRKNSNKDGYWRFFRMAEIYLNYIEANFYANNKTVTSDALEIMNKIRKRAGMPPVPSDVSSKEFEYRIKNERRVELAFEEHRYYDVRRWKIQKDVEGVVTGMKISGNNYERVLIQKRNVVDDKYLMWPIPRTEQIKYNLAGVYFQNPGW